MQIPQALIHSLTGIEGFDRDSFLQAHDDYDALVSVRFNPAKCPTDVDVTVNSALPVESKIPWSSNGYYLSQRPSFTFDPLLHAGVYYVQEPSSMFLEEALKQTIDISKPLRVLDLCAAPGGKSTLIQAVISSESLLISNEVIRSRASILQENMIKWGANNVIVTSNDPVDFSSLKNYFDVIVIDAPCSGSGLFRKEPDSLDEWSPENVHHCAMRQQRILADAWPALKQEGVLIYATCSYSPEEDEAIADWLTDEFAAAGMKLRTEQEWGIIESHSPKNKIPGYRFFPGKVKGEGFFICCMQKKEGTDFAMPKTKQNTVRLTKNEMALAEPFLRNGSHSFIKHNDQVYTLMPEHFSDWQFLRDKLYIKKAGVLMGKFGSNELIPEHELALSTMIASGIPSIAVNREEAISYLRKEDISPGTAPKGWTLVQYESHNLGWIKVLGNRINNYYPKEWRILKVKQSN